MKDKLFEAHRKIYWEAGIWRRYSFEEFIAKLIEIYKEIKEPCNQSLFPHIIKIK